MKDWVAHFREAAQGMSVSHVWRGHGSALFLEIGKLTPSNGIRRVGTPDAPSGEIGVMIQWSWRVEDERSILCGSWSDEKLWRPTFDRLVGEEITDLTTFSRLPELRISLSGGLHVASFMTADGDPAWTLFDRRTSSDVVAGCRSGAIQQLK
jgi:hypothetical protein